MVYSAAAQQLVYGGTALILKGTKLICGCVFRGLNKGLNRTPNFQGVIPGGQSFSIPVGETSTKVGSGVGFNWTPDVRIGTTFLLVGGDDRGLGVAGSNLFTIQQGASSCLNSTSPSSTAGSPAGGSYPTSTDGSGTSGGHSG